MIGQSMPHLPQRQDILEGELSLEPDEQPSETETEGAAVLGVCVFVCVCVCVRVRWRNSRGSEANREHGMPLRAPKRLDVELMVSVSTGVKGVGRGSLGIN